GAVWGRIGRLPPCAASASSRLPAPDISFDWSSRPPGSIHISDSTGPGQIALTSTPPPAWRSAKRRESESSAAFATEYSGIAAEGRLPAVEQTLTTRPQPRASIGAAAARLAQRRGTTLRP